MGQHVTRSGAVGKASGGVAPQLVASDDRAQLTGRASMLRRKLIAGALAGATMAALAVGALAQAPQEGRSAETAVLIRSDSGSAGGVASEGAWLRQHYPGWQRVRQALMRRDGRRYDRIDLESPSGERVSVYFDITDAFGLR
jgi:hypothetical protein